MVRDYYDDILYKYEYPSDRDASAIRKPERKNKEKNGTFVVFVLAIAWAVMISGLFIR